jgi:CheY-like chemotaxis protein
MLSHEMRNPLAALGSAAQVLRLSEPSSEASAKARGVVERQTGHMTHLIEDLLDINRVVMGKVALAREPLDLADVAREVVRSWREAGRFASHRVELEAQSAPVHADRSRLEQIFSNLLDNAVKFSPPAAASTSGCPWTAAMRCSPSRTKAKASRTKPSTACSIFSCRGRRALTGAAAASAFGLALVKRLVELHGGRSPLRATARARARASRCACRWRRRRRWTRAHRARAAGSAPQRGSRILLVEDNDDAREMLTMMLSMDGHKVRAARDGAEALRLAAAEVPEIMIVDVGLPDMSGHELAGRVRAEAWGARVRLFALTGYGQPEDRQRAIAAGFDEHLTKPVEGSLLSSLIAAPDADRRERWRSRCLRTWRVHRLCVAPMMDWTDRHCRYFLRQVSSRASSTPR